MKRVNNTKLALAGFLLSLILTQPTQAASSQFNVDSTKGWQTAPILVQKGQKLSFSAEGRWNVDFRNFDFVGPEGYTPQADSAIFQGCKLAPIPYGILLVRIGDDPDFQSLDVGGDRVASHDGALSFRIHDGDGCLLDNAGSLTVTVTTPDGFPAAISAPPQYVCLTGGGCEGVYTPPKAVPGFSLPPWFNTPQAAKCLLTIGDAITTRLNFALPELEYFTVFYTEAGNAGLPLTRFFTVQETILYGQVLVKASSSYIIGKLPEIVAEEVDTPALGKITVIDGCKPWVLELIAAPLYGLTTPAFTRRPARLTEVGRKTVTSIASRESWARQ